MNSKIILRGLSPKDYVHPKEREVFLANAQGVVLDGVIDQLTELSVTLSREIMLGKYVEATRHNYPEVYGILEDVCSILQCRKIPKLYVTHEYSLFVFQVGSNMPCIMLPDMLCEQADADMLRFMLGNSVGMILGGHIRLSTVNSVLGAIPPAIPFRLALQARQRAADLSSDRAGLLACQNIAAALRCILWMLGMPPSELLRLTDEETMRIAKEYTHELSLQQQGIVTEAAEAWKTWMGTSSPGYYRIAELCAWYEDGYPQLMERFRR